MFFGGGYKSVLILYNFLNNKVVLKRKTGWNVCSQPKAHVFGLWDETGAPGENNQTPSRKEPGPKLDLNP